MIVNPALEIELSKCDKNLKISPFDPKLHIKRGMTNFKLGRLQQSLKDFNKAEELNPQLTPYLWQRGLTYYYLGKYSKAGRQFELDLSINSKDVEETIWFYLSLAQLDGSLSALHCLLPVKYDSRPFMTQIYQVFARKSDIKSLVEIKENQDLKHTFFSYLYAGLYYESQGYKQKSLDYIRQAVNYKIDDYMWYLAHLHLHLRQ